MADNGVWGWGIVSGYVLCFLVAVVALKRTPHTSGTDRRAWLLVLAAVLCLGIDKQLDLQTLVARAIREIALRDGWYAERRAYQRLFIGTLVGALAIASVVLLSLFRKQSFGSSVAVAGVLILGVFVALRAASFHYVDLFLGTAMSGAATQLLELGGLAIILLGAGCYRPNRNIVAAPDGPVSFGQPNQGTRNP